MKSVRHGDRVGQRPLHVGPKRKADGYLDADGGQLLVQALRSRRERTNAPDGDGRQEERQERQLSRQRGLRQ